MKATVSDLIRFLKEFPGDAEVWGYEGEVSGIIISHKTVSGIYHNNGVREVTHKKGPLKGKKIKYD